MSHFLIAAVGVAYFIVGLDQWAKGNVNMAGMWLGYAFSQIWLYRMAV